MKLSRKSWSNYVARLSAINKTAGRKMQEWIDKNGTGDVDKLVEVAHALVTKYGEASSAAACDMYDMVAEAEGVSVPPAEPKATQNINYVNKAVRNTLDRAPGTIPSTVSEMVKRTGAETTLKNAVRDGAYFAWVPNGDTCPFCITLASNGWRRASRKTAGGDHAEHIHKNCDCEFAISFNGPGDIEGYDPDKYLEMYENAEGTSSKDKINSMRRAQYAADPEKYREQSRAVYAKQNMKKRQGNLWEKYGSEENLMLYGTSEELNEWGKIKKEIGFDEKRLLSEMSKNADNWEKILSRQTEDQMEKLTNLLLDTATDEELGALNMWTGETYALINNYLRYGTNIDELSRNAAQHIEKILDRMVIPEDIIVRRGTGTGHIFAKMPTGWRDDPTLLVGKEFTDSGFTATTPFSKGGFSGAGANHANLIIKVPKGTHGAYIEKVAHNELEKELLLQKGYTYRIIKAEKYIPNPRFPDHPNYKVWVEVVSK